MKQLIKEILPPVLYRGLKRFSKPAYGWTGDFEKWEEAASQATGYDSDIILRKVEEATRKVMEGEAVYERDSVLFEEPEYNWPLLAALLYVAANQQGKLDILDFGGSLGSTYFQNRIFLRKLEYVRWNVVEQPHFTKTGEGKFSSEQLRFYSSISECLHEGQTDTILLSSVLQYIEKPYELLKEIVSFDFSTIIIDRMPFNTADRNRICIQKVPPSIYDASYPCHLLSKHDFIDFFLRNGYQLISEFDALDGKTTNYEFKGLIFEK